MYFIHYVDNISINDYRLVVRHCLIFLAQLFIAYGRDYVSRKLYIIIIIFRGYPLYNRSLTSLFICRRYAADDGRG